MLRYRVPQFRSREGKCPLAIAEGVRAVGVLKKGLHGRMKCP